VSGETWVVSGDYKTEADGLCEPFEPVRCHGFISECTFGLPVFAWPPQAQVMAEIRDWWAEAAAAGRTAILGAYSLGKAQRVLAGLAALGDLPGPILTHGAVEATNALLRGQGYALPETRPVAPEFDRNSAPGALVVAPPAALGSDWTRRFGPSVTGFASGWMRLRGIRRRRALDRGFVLSDHADWPGLNAAIAATGAQKVLVTHGYTAPFARWLRERGYEAGELATEFGDGDDGESG